MTVVGLRRTAQSAEMPARGAFLGPRFRGGDGAEAGVTVVGLRRTVQSAEMLTRGAFLGPRFRGGDGEEAEGR